MKPIFAAAVVTGALVATAYAQAQPGGRAVAETTPASARQQLAKSLCTRVVRTVGQRYFRTVFGPRSQRTCVRRNMRLAARLYSEASRTCDGTSESRRCIDAALESVYRAANGPLAKAARRCKKKNRRDEARRGNGPAAKRFSRCLLAGVHLTGEPGSPGDPSDNSGVDGCQQNRGERPVLSLPFAAANQPEQLLPMGETVYHPKPANPEGHPGIDFQWFSGQTVPILTSAAGTITEIRPAYWMGTSDVMVRTGCYLTGYTELGSYGSSLKVGDNLPAGTPIGYPNTGVRGTEPPGFRMIHWEFGNWTGASNPDRLCPLTYFDGASRTLIEEIWAATVWEHKPTFPHICSGDYLGKDN